MSAILNFDPQNHVWGAVMKLWSKYEDNLTNGFEVIKFMVFVTMAVNGLLGFQNSKS